jgi:hypothetical protein
MSVTLAKIVEFDAKNGECVKENAAKTLVETASLLVDHSYARNFDHAVRIVQALDLN